MGAELGLGAMGASVGDVFEALYCCDGAERADTGMVLCFLAATDNVVTGSGALGVGGIEVFAAAFEVGAGPVFEVVAVFTAARGFDSAVAVDAAFVFDVLAFVASVFFACAVVLPSFSTAVAFIEVFFDLVVVLALGALVVGAAATVSFSESFIA